MDTDHLPADSSAVHPHVAAVMRRAKQQRDAGHIDFETFIGAGEPSP